MKSVLFFLVLAFQLAFIGRALAGPAFPGAHGNYGGLVQVPPDDTFSLANPRPNGHLPTQTALNSGTVIVLLLDSGRFTAKLNWQSYGYSFEGKLDATNATFARDFADRGFPGQTLSLSFLLHAGTRIIDCVLSSKSGASTLFTAEGSLSGAVPDNASALAFGGTVNSSFIDPPGYGTVPQDISGDGFTITRVSRSKGFPARIIGRLPDAQPFSAGSALRGTKYAIISGLYPRNHRFGGLTVGQLSTSDLVSIKNIVLWAKRAAADPKYYPAGFETGFGILTKGYQKVVTRFEIPHISTSPGPVRATLTLIDGNLGEDIMGDDIPLIAQIKIGLFGVQVLNPNPQGITVATNAAAGTWSGSFIHPVSGRRTSFHGGFVEAKGSVNGEGRGSFKGSVASSSADLAESGSARITVN